MDDFYQILEVSETASPEQLRRAYLALAVKYHPDRNPGDKKAEDQFKNISQAYAILSDPAARAKYERLRASRKKANPKKRPAAQASPQQDGPKKEQPRPAYEDIYHKTNRGPQSPPKENFQKQEAKPSGPGPKVEPSFEEILNAFFQSEQGRQTLKGLEEELGKAGLNFETESFSRWFKKNQSDPKQPEPDKKQESQLAPRSAKPGVLKRLTNWLMKLGAKDLEKEEKSFDITYNLSLTSAALKTGTVIEISYLQDNISRRLSVKIPPGLTDGAKLRLKNQGSLKPDQTRGDLTLLIQQQEPNL